MRIILAVVSIAYGASVYAAPTGCIGNRVWLDANKDGIQQYTEEGISGVGVQLVDGSGREIDSVETQSRGYFSVCGPVGPATLQIDVPDGYEATTPKLGDSIHEDSDIDALGIVSVEIKGGKKISEIDAGFVSVSNNNEPDPPEGDPDIPDESDPDAGDTARDEFRYGVWIESRNAMPVTADEGVVPAFPKFDFAHVRGKSLSAVGRDRNDPEYVVNILDAARDTDTVLDLQLGSSSDYGWNYSTGRGNFSLSRWKNGVSAFKDDGLADAAIARALADGTIRYIFLIDEPHHSRWSPGWDGKHSGSGNINHVTNEDLDSMAAHVKSLWGNNVKTIVRAAPVRLVQSRRGGMYVFNHVTHAYLSPGPRKWLPGNVAEGKGFEWWLRQKDNHTNDLTNCSSFAATGLEMAIMLQWGFESVGNPFNGENDWKSGWWAGNVKYPYQGKSSYVKAAPLEMDFIIKHFLAPRNPVTCELDSEGELLADSIVSFRWDRIPTDRGKLPMSTYPHYIEFHDKLAQDIENGNVVPRIGLPLGIGAQ